MNAVGAFDNRLFTLLFGDLSGVKFDLFESLKLVESLLGITIISWDKRIKIISPTKNRLSVD